MKNELPLIEEFPYRTGRDIFVFAFVYPAVGKPFMLKGGSCKLDDYLRDKMKCSYIVHYSRNRFGSSWSTVSIKNLQDDFRGYCFDNSKKLTYRSKQPYDLGEQFTISKRNGKNIYVNQKGKRIFEKKVRRMPRSFPKELLPFAKLTP